jgi:hypothetical protein
VTRTRRIALAGAAALAGAGLTATAAIGASDIKLREVHDGGGSGADYIELQMYSAGQNTVAGSYIATFDSAGNPLTPYYPLPANVPNGQTQRTVLITDGGAGTPAADFVAPLQVPVPAGSACWVDFSSGADDCVAWGSTAPPENDPSPVGVPVLFFGAGLQAGGTIRRTIAPGCPTLLEAGDDHGDSATDFAVTSADPRNNASAPVETACSTVPVPPDTEITGGPKNKTRSKKTTFEFTATTPNSSFECNLDGAGFKLCESPFKVKVKKGKHGFQVRATDPAGQVDPAPAQADWKVKPKKHKD